MRRWDWVARLNDAIEAARERPFDYGSDNCAIFAAECVDAIVDGSAWVEELRTHFDDKDSALRYLAQSGGIEAAVTARLGEPVAWPRLGRGDLCLVESGDGPGLGVCLGESIALLGPDGFVLYPLDRALKGWKVA